MDMINFYYPNTRYIVEVKYSGDIAISCIRCKDDPIEKDNSRGFTKNFFDYESAKKYAVVISKELSIPFT